MNIDAGAARPFSVTVIAVVVLYVAATNLLRAIQSFLNWNVLAELLSFSPAYLTISGLAWSISGAWLVWGLWRGRAWARRFSVVFFLAYSIYFWIDRLLLPGSSIRNNNWIFQVCLQILVFLILIWIMSRKRTRRYFGEPYDYRSKNPTAA
jgi:hypothetical protein